MSDLDSIQVMGNMLRPNGLGGYLLSYSQLSSWQRCQLQAFYQLRARVDPTEPQPEFLSATVYGSVMHRALHVFEQLTHEKREDALEASQRTFAYYWHPDNLDKLGLKITAWVTRQTWSGLLERGKLALAEYAEMRAKDKSHLLGLEYEFAVPIEVRGVTHTLHGILDRLVIDRFKTKPYIQADDFKSGKQPTYLRYNQQGTLYAYATTRPEFWTGWPGSGLAEFPAFDPATVQSISDAMASHGYRLHVGQDPALQLAARKFRWINVQELKYADAGWRNERDYARLGLMIDAYVRACEHQIYSLSPSGDVCNYCAFKDVCGGVGLPDLDEGAP